MTLNDWAEKELTDLVSKREPDLEKINQSIRVLNLTGVFKILNEGGRVRKVPSESINYSAAIIYEAGRSAGYQEALEDLSRFMEKYIYGRIVGGISLPPEEYGWADVAVQSGNLTQEEVDELKRSGDAPGSSK
jgi:hypothetical protein